MIRLELSDQMVAIIGEALGAQPYRAVANVIAEIQKQVTAQQQQQLPQSNGKAEIEISEQLQ